MASPSSSASGKGLPKVVVFDLDGCVWYPEMYHLWGSGGAPFKPLPNGNVKDRRGEEVELMADVRSIFYELKTDPKWNNTLVAAASCCDEPEWARECIQKMTVGDGIRLKDCFAHAEIYKGSKTNHFRSISSKTGVPVNQMLFLDNEYGNCQTVARIGVTVLYTPEGVKRADFEDAIAKFPAPGQVLGPRKRSGYW